MSMLAIYKVNYEGVTEYFVIPIGGGVSYASDLYPDATKASTDVKASRSGGFCIIL